MATQQYCLRWNNHQPNFISVFSSLLNSESLVDVTLAAEGRHLQAHKVVLSACSSYFQSLFTVNPCQHPIVILKDVKFLDLKVMVDFMYYGEVNVSQEQLPHILKTAEMLKIKGLAEIPVEQTITKTETLSERSELLNPIDLNSNHDNVIQRQSVSPSTGPTSPSSKRSNYFRKRFRKTSSESGSGSAEKSEESHIDPSNQHIACSTVIRTDSSSYSAEGNIMKCSTSESEVQRSCNTETIHETPGKQHYVQSLISQPEFRSSPKDVSNDENSAATTTGVTESQEGTWNVTEPPNNQHFNNSFSVSHQQHHSGFSSGNQLPHFVTQSSNVDSQQPSKKRIKNPQGEENFIKALDAVRYGGIGFCKAARMYGVNNRTLWLEYKKRGYPNIRLSIKSKKSEQNSSSTATPNTTLKQSTQSTPEYEDEPPNHPLLGLMNGTQYYDPTKQIEYAHHLLLHQQSVQHRHKSHTSEIMGNLHNMCPPPPAVEYHSTVNFDHINQ